MGGGPGGEVDRVGAIQHDIGDLGGQLDRGLGGGGEFVGYAERPGP
jgi:hypothetical protein